MSNGIPTIEDIKNCNNAIVYLKSSSEQPTTIIIQGTFEKIIKEGINLIIKTNEQYAVFRSSEITAIHFYRNR